MQQFAKQPRPDPQPGAAKPSASIPATAKPGKPAAESPAPANTDDTPEEAQMPATPITPENVLTRFDKLLIEFEKQRADAAEREREAAARQEKQNEAMRERFAQMDKENAERDKAITERFAQVDESISNLRTEIYKAVIGGAVFVVALLGILQFVLKDSTSPVIINYPYQPAAEQPAPAPQPSN